ncbi:ankyrin repeat-containing domain protein [Cercophora newfieldiana]|uniref:Ankyrin repeat-containing domain protein n=1 Tax=Cercophora newfieldiana TaxID=92897 RepID=A0AA40CSV1_9PEZI|nr:ankyrin repeat-containing domain protein [Cercophora newfieldiana]
MAEAGNLAMVRYSLDKGGKPYNGLYLEVPLAKAVTAFGYDVVDLLLERGADPNKYERRGRTLLTVAVRTGSMVMMRKLVDAGLKVRDPQVWPNLDADERALRQAVKMEHRAMVELLLDTGAGPESGRASVLRTAERLGLESMADLLRSRGITRTATEVDPAKEAA